MHFLVLVFIYFMFFLSGAAALIYQVVWVRSLTLIFGGSHLAVATVLSIFMAGLAIGGYLIGKYADTVRKPLRLYGLLELGIALFAVIFIGLMNLYPSIYMPLAQGKDGSPLYLSLIRILFSIVALIIPTILMGGTLPVLTRFIANHPNNLGNRLSLLYGFNTLGAVLGAAAAGFFLLRLYSVSTTFNIAIAMNVCIGLASIFLQNKAPALFVPISSITKNKETLLKRETAIPFSSDKSVDPFSYQLVLWGIGVSGFCALGYEVLWSRILTIVIGASVYGFTIMLVAFLTGIALGSEAYGVFLKILKFRDKEIGKSVFWFGMVQVIIGIAALLVTLYLRDLPSAVMGLQNFFLRISPVFFGAKLWSSFILAFSYMVVPAFFMGLAFPLAGRVHADYKKQVGSAVGEVLAFNTVGAILGAAVSGFGMIYLFGIERSLQMLIVVNIGYGLMMISTVMQINRAPIIMSGFTLIILLFLAFNQQALRIWDTKYFAIYRNNAPEAFRTPEMIREAMENTDVLYYAEGAESIVSSIKIKGGEQSFITNGRVEASTHLKEQQCQFILGHLPMFLNRDPKRVLVLGAGSGMTLGATSIHPGVENITLVEIEPKVIGVARTFAQYNHHVLDNPKLKIVFNDGRNFLMTTKETFDVITADPIHPWFRGAGYLYATEYFKLASEHLRPGGIICQWLPIYELTPENIRSVVRTFQEHFPYTMLWLTHYDAEMVGSNSPIIIHETDLARRIAQPLISEDLNRVMMGSAGDLLSYFVMGTEGMKKFSQGAIVNTDDNLYLEFSAPYSIGKFTAMGDNVNAIIQHRESILPYLLPAKGALARAEQGIKWSINKSAAEIAGPALALFLSGRHETPEFKKYMSELDTKYPWFAPGRFLKSEYAALSSMNPVLLRNTAFIFANDRGERKTIVISAVLVPISRERASVVFVDNDARVIYGQAYVASYENDPRMNEFVNDIMTSIQILYRQEVVLAVNQKRVFPPERPTMQKIRDTIISKLRAHNE